MKRDHLVKAKQVGRGWDETLGLAVRDIVLESPDEDSEVVSSNLAPLTNLPATHTPRPVANFMAMIGNMHNRRTVLDPSAGDGGLLESIHNYRVGEKMGWEFISRRHGLVGIELNKQNVQKATDRGFVVQHGDFLKMMPEDCEYFQIPVDGIVMCPPANSMEHIVHAYVNWLRPGGTLVALARINALGNFREFEHEMRSREISGQVVKDAYRLPKDMFQVNGENVETCVIHMTKNWSSQRGKNVA